MTTPSSRAPSRARLRTVSVLASAACPTRDFGRPHTTTLHRAAPTRVLGGGARPRLRYRRESGSRGGIAARLKALVVNTEEHASSVEGSCRVADGRWKCQRCRAESEDESAPRRNPGSALLWRACGQVSLCSPRLPPSGGAGRVGRSRRLRRFPVADSRQSGQRHSRSLTRSHPSSRRSSCSAPWSSPRSTGERQWHRAHFTSGSVGDTLLASIDASAVVGPGRAP